MELKPVSYEEALQAELSKLGGRTLKDQRKNWEHLQSDALAVHGVSSNTLVEVARDVGRPLIANLPFEDRPVPPGRT